jgi:hypothetical protein
MHLRSEMGHVDTTKLSVAAEGGTKKTLGAPSRAFFFIFIS